MASMLLRWAEDTREEVSLDIGHLPPSPTLIYLAPTWGDFQKLQPKGNAPSWSVGTAYPALNLIILRSPRTVKGGRTEIESVFKHEYAHLALWTATKGQRIPRWLDEGFAMIQSRQWNLSWTYILAKGVLTKSLLTLEQLEHDFPLTQHESQLAYAESFSFVAFMKNEYGPETLAYSIKGISHGLDADTAFRLAAGLGIRDMERKWKKELKRRYSWIPIATSFFSLWFLASLLFLLGYWRKRRRSKEILREWEREESLTEHAVASKSADEDGV